MRRYKATYDQHELLFIMPTQDDMVKPNTILEVGSGEHYAIFEAESDYKAYWLAKAIFDNHYYQAIA